MLFSVSDETQVMWYVVLNVILLCQEELNEKTSETVGWREDRKKNDGARSMFKMDLRCHRDRNNVRRVG